MDSRKRSCPKTKYNISKKVKLNTSKRPFLLGLPAEVIQIILESLGTNTQINSTRLVCKKFNEIGKYILNKRLPSLRFDENLQFILDIDTDDEVITTPDMVIRTLRLATSGYAVVTPKPFFSGGLLDLYHNSQLDCMEKTASFLRDDFYRVADSGLKLYTENRNAKPFAHLASFLRLLMSCNRISGINWYNLEKNRIRLSVTLDGFSIDLVKSGRGGFVIHYPTESGSLISLFSYVIYFVNAGKPATSHEEKFRMGRRFALTHDEELEMSQCLVVEAVIRGPENFLQALRDHFDKGREPFYRPELTRRDEIDANLKLTALINLKSLKGRTINTFIIFEVSP